MRVNFKLTGNLRIILRKSTIEMELPNNISIYWALDLLLKDIDPLFQHNLKNKTGRYNLIYLVNGNHVEDGYILREQDYVTFLTLISQD